MSERQPIIFPRQGPALSMESIRILRNELFATPVKIQFGAIFLSLSGDRNAPFYGPAIVTDIGAGGMFKADILEVKRVLESDGTTTLKRAINLGGDQLRDNILKMTGEILSLDDYMNMLKDSRTLSMSEKEWEEERERNNILMHRRWRILPGIPPLTSNGREMNALQK